MAPVGFEPTSPFGQRFLRPSRLPIPSQGQLPPTGFEPASPFGQRILSPPRRQLRHGGYNHPLFFSPVKKSNPSPQG